MGILSVICDTIINVGKSVCAAAGKLCSTLRPMAVNMGKSLNTALTIISAVVQVIGIIKGVIKENEKVEDIGEKALQAEENEKITLESCNNDFQEYTKRIREYSVDNNKLHSPEQRLAAGILFVQKGLEQQSPYANLASLYPLMVLNKDYFNTSRIEKYLDLAQTGKFNLEKVAKYFEGTCSAAEANEAEEFIVKTEKNLNPQASASDIEKQTNEIRREAEAKL